jgi:hypothetical protein
MRRDTPPLPSDGIYRAILIVLVATIVIGALVAVAGDTVLENPAMEQVGTGAALIGAVLYIFFRVLGAREARRRAAEGTDHGPEQSADLDE